MKIPKANFNRDNFPCWVDVIDVDGNQKPPVIICKCGQPMGIYNHNIDANGVVTPSFYHRDKNVNEDMGGCQFHEMIELDGYSKK